MEPLSAVGALSALAHPGRLEVFRLLVRAGPEGMAAGDIARATGSLANTLSANLNLLAGAGLVSSRRDGRSIIYAAGYDRMPGGGLLRRQRGDLRAAGRHRRARRLLRLGAP
jgi:DNA-binding transcriptional ArsR family regulator